MSHRATHTQFFVLMIGDYSTVHYMCFRQHQAISHCNNWSFSIFDGLDNFSTQKTSEMISVNGILLRLLAVGEEHMMKK